MDPENFNSKELQELKSEFNDLKETLDKQRIVNKEILEHIQKQKRAGNRVNLDLDIKPYEDNYEKSLQVKHLYKRINALGLADRSVILLWLEGLSYDEIGAILGISVKNVSFKLVRIKEKLKQMSNI